MEWVWMDNILFWLLLYVYACVFLVELLCRAESCLSFIQAQDFGCKEARCDAKNNYEKYTNDEEKKNIIKNPK